MVTDDYGNTCSTKASPYINDCNFDLAGAMLQHLYGPLMRATTRRCRPGFVEFDQPVRYRDHGMAAMGWVYVPRPAKPPAATCRLHVALHGCGQNVTLVQQQYVRNTGYNRWADTNNIVVLYPQTSTQATNGCWRLVGLRLTANYAKKSGPQIAAIKAMVDQLSSGSGRRRRGRRCRRPPAWRLRRDQQLDEHRLERRHRRGRATTCSATAPRSTRWASPAGATPTAAWLRPPPIPGRWAAGRQRRRGRCRRR